MNDNLLSNGELKDSYFARPITKNDDYIPYEVVEKYNKELARYKNTLEEIREMLKIAEKTKTADKHFEYMDNALNKCNEVLNADTV